LRNSGGYTAGEPRTPPRCIASKPLHDPVRQRQPHGPDLFVAGRTRVEKAAGDGQMRERIAVVEQVAVPVEPPQREGADRSARHKRGRETDPAGSRTLLARALGSFFHGRSESG
jgi:hypothetical protein